MLKQIIGKIWLVWSALVFVFSWPIIALVYFVTYRLLPKEQKYKNGFAATKIWGKFVLFFIGVRLTVFGKENIDGSTPCVFVCNHSSQIDIPINFVTSPIPFVILSKVEVAKVPVVGTNLKYAHVMVNRKDAEDRKQAMEKLGKHLKAGRSILLYPEGSRNRESSPLGSFKKGAFVLAILHQVPIIPITIIGSKDINNPSNPLALYPGKVTVHFDSPISTKGKTTDNLLDLMEQTRSVMLKHF